MALLSRKTDNNDEDKNSKGKKICIIKRKISFEDDKNCLEALSSN